MEVVVFQPIPAGGKRTQSFLRKADILSDGIDGIVNEFSQSAESGQNFLGAESHGVQDFLLGQAARRDVQHELLRADGIHVITDSLNTFVRSAPHRHDVRRLLRHGLARLFGLG
jgi:hypothetical protein